MNQNVEWAQSLAEELLADALPRRWAHTQAVGQQARALCGVLHPEATQIVESAAWLHDIGYSPSLVESGFHPLDGARYLRDVHGTDPTLYQLVAHHSGALAEAEERGLVVELMEFGPADRHRQLLDVLVAADMTSGPDGSSMLPTQRIAEILSRYEDGDPVFRAITRSGPSLIATTQRVLGEAGDTNWTRAASDAPGERNDRTGR